MAELYEQAEKDYLNGMKYKDIADKYNVSINTVKSWKQRYKWMREKGAHKQKSMHTNKTDAKQINKRIDKTFEVSEDLTEKQRLFCLYYLKYFNATKAYQKAYDCTYLTARVEGHRNLAKPNIKREIERFRKEVADGLLIDAEVVLQKYIDIAFADITDFVEFGREEVTDENGNQYEVNRVKFKESSEVDGTIITEVKQGKDGVSVKLADKMKALDFLSKYTDLLSENDRKKLQEEKLKTEIAKTQAEIDNMNDDEEDDTINIVITRKEDRG